MTEEMTYTPGPTTKKEMVEAVDELSVLCHVQRIRGCDLWEQIEKLQSLVKHLPEKSIETPFGIGVKR